MLCLTQPLLVGPPAPAVGPDELGQARDMVAVEAVGAHRQRIEDPGQLRLLGAAESNSCGEQFGLRAVGDHDLVLARRVPVPARDHAELQQHLLHVDGQLLAAGRVATPESCCAAGPSTSRRPRTTPAGRRASPRPETATASPEPTCRQTAGRTSRQDARRRQRRQVLDVEFEQPRARRDRAFGDIPRSTDDRVVGGHDHARSSRGRRLLKPARASDTQPSLMNAPARRASIAANHSAGPNSTGAVRCMTTWSSGRISSISFHSSVGTPATSTRHSSGWFAVPVTRVALRRS